jgi:2,4-dienoyl-CoA reductase
MLPPKTFEGKIAFVTGGGTGLGKAISTKLSELGALVVIGSRNINVLQETANEIQEATKNKVLPIQMDVRKSEAVKHAADVCVQEVGLPHIIINNAAGNFICPSENLSANAFRNIVDIVLNGSAYVTLEFGKRLIEKKQGT